MGSNPIARQVMMDFFGPGSNVDRRFLPTYDELTKVLEHVRALRPDGKIVLIMGSWDMLHIGHSRYLEAGAEYGDFVIIGADSDEKVRARKKGESRPVVPQEERIEMLCHLRHTNVVVLKELDHPKYHLIKTVCPDVLIAVEGTYSPKELKALKEFCGDVVVLPRQAETSTSAKLRRLLIDFRRDAGDLFAKAMEAAKESIESDLDALLGKKTG